MAREYNRTEQSSVLDPDVNNTIFVVVTDNSKVQSVELKIIGPGQNELPDTKFTKVTGVAIKDKYNLSEKDYTKYHDHFYEYEIPKGLADGPYEYEITAKDDNGHEATDTGKFFIRRP